MIIYYVLSVGSVWIRAVGIIKQIVFYKLQKSEWEFKTKITYISDQKLIDLF